MSENVYQRLAHFLDRLPGSFPPTESGVELRILRRLFTPEQAELAMRLTLIAEEARVVARRAKLPVEQTRQMLDEMADQGLIYDFKYPGKPTLYMATQFIVGIWENQVNNLSPELVQDFGEYITTAFDPETWRKAPQLRTIPVGEAVGSQLEVLAYERAEELVQAQHSFACGATSCRCTIVPSRHRGIGVRSQGPCLSSSRVMTAPSRFT